MLNFQKKKSFDRAFYLRKYPDVAAARIDPWRHYLAHGASEGRKPNPRFDPDYYRKQTSAGEALSHFLDQQGPQCPAPHPLFDCASYLRAHPEARRANPLLYFLTHPRKAPVEGGQFGCAS